MQTRKNPVFIAVILAAVMFSTLACSISSLSIGRGATDIDITLTEDQVNRLFSQVDVADGAHDRLLHKIDRVEMHDGYMRIFGDGIASDGSEAYGSYDVSLATEGDVLQVEIIGVDMPGIDLKDPRINVANQEIAKGLTESVTDSHGELKFKSASIKDGELKMQIQVNNQNK